MSEEPTRATARPVDLPSHGSVGPADPHADPATDPAMRAIVLDDEVVADPPTVPTKTDPPAVPRAGRTRTSGLWTGLILSAIVLLFLLIFIVQNNDSMQINFLGMTGRLPTGVALLLAAIAGLLLVAIPGGLRILQLRRTMRRNR